MAEKILVIIDMQKDFVDGALGTKEAVSIVPAVKKLIGNYPSECIYATKDTHQPDYLSTSEGHYLPVVHCVKDTDGWQFDGNLLELENVKVFEKPTFGSQDLIRELTARSEQGPIEVVMAGVCTDICVVSNALLLKAALPETKITVYEDCCAGVTRESHNAALLTMKMCQIEIDRFVGELEES